MKFAQQLAERGGGGIAQATRGKQPHRLALRLNHNLLEFGAGGGLVRQTKGNLFVRLPLFDAITPRPQHGFFPLLDALKNVA
ncbi:hypothetical protein [Geminisphaera colitermitum]|uniref:hypothetical protein n=1 Tax=Geminisphaera colitermitum TaxID=1148786 RepID=UPI0005B878DA|nr:hypothetical protein [Geminisphaera colitermitum]